jgi:multidrug efflux pump
MNISAPFIHRPVATTLLTLAVALAGVVAFNLLPVAPMPQVDNPVISVGAALPGASPEIMASSVAAPLERQFGHIAGVNEMTSSSYLGTTGITLQFDLNRNIDGAARDVQAAINAARSYLPANLPSNPTWRKVNPADSPIMIMSLTSDVYDRGQLYDAGSSIMQQALSQIDGVGQVFVGGSSLPAVRVEVNPVQLNSCGLGLKRRQCQRTQRPDFRRAHDCRYHGQRSIAQGRLVQVAHCGLPEWRRHQTLRCGGRAGFGREPARGRVLRRQALRGSGYFQAAASQCY